MRGMGEVRMEIRGIKTRGSEGIREREERVVTGVLTSGLK